MATLNKKLRGRLYSYYIARLGAQPYNHGWLKVPTCPNCGTNKGKFGINVSQNRTNCFKCEFRPSAVNLAMELEKITEYREFLRFLSDGDFSYYDYTEEEVVIKEIKYGIELPEGFNLLDPTPTNRMGRIALKYLQGRGFDVSYLRRKGWGYCNSGPLFGYLILPMFQDGKLIYYNARNLFKVGPRYKNPNEEDIGVGKSFIIYNREALFIYKKVYLCEGIFNAETVSHDKGIASSGKNLSRYQINDLIKSPVEEIVILLDSDAKLKAIQLAQELCFYKKVKVVFLPEDKDANDLGRKATMEIIRETPFNTYSSLMLLQNKYNLNERTVHTY